MTEYQKLTENGSDGSSESRQYFVVRSLLNTSMEIFERRQRALISNCTLQKLLKLHNTMSEQQVADYFSLLGRTVEHPSKTLELVSEAKFDKGEMLIMVPSARSPQPYGALPNCSTEARPSSILQP